MSPVFQQSDYYSTLDTVRFGTELKPKTVASNTVSAAGTVMLGLLVGNTKPVLTQTQAIDNSYLLNVLADQAESAAFLTLVRDHVIQVKFHDSPPLLESPQRFTVLNAFASALERREKFHLSAWPEINADYSLRSELVRCLQQTKSHDRMVTEVEDLAGVEVGRRFSGLMRLNRAVEKAGPPAQTTRLPKGSYCKSVVDLITTLLSQRADAADLILWLLKRAAAYGHADGGPGGVDLDTRTGWRELLKIYLNQHSREDKQVALVSRQLDLATHKIIGQSLDCTGKELDLPTPEDSDDLVSGLRGDDIPVDRLVALSKDKDRMNWLTWKTVSELLAELRDADLSPHERLNHLVERHTDAISAQRLDGWLGALTANAPFLVTVVVGDTVQNYTSGTWGGITGAVAAAITGTVTILITQPFANPVSKQAREWFRQRAGAKWEASISGGTASWQDEIGT
jgi:hypothetical protein